VKVTLQGTASIELATAPPGVVEMVQRALTLTRQQIDGEQVPVPFWTMDDNWLHVPRGWLLSRPDICSQVTEWTDARSDGTPLPPGTRAHVTFGVHPFPAGQPQAIHDAHVECVRNTHGGLFVAPTRSGKSLMSLELACRLGGSTLILVDNGGLMSQFGRDIVGPLQSSYGIVRMNEFDVSHPFTIATAQTLARRQLTNDIRKRWRTVIVDECSSAPCEQIWSAVRRLHARFVIGLSATPDRGDGLGDAIQWVIGPTLTTLERQLEADVHWRPLLWTHEGSISQWGKTSWVKAEKAAMDDRSRVQTIAEDAVNAVSAGRRVLVMCGIVEHAHRIANAVSQLGVTPGLYLGEHTQMSHKVTLSTYKKASKGIDFQPPPTCFIPAGPRSDIRQAVGRALQPQVPHRTLILDPIDLTRPLIKWAMNRCAYYRSCGFQFRNSLEGVLAA